MKDFNLKKYLCNKTLMSESYDSDKFGQTQENKLKSKIDSSAMGRSKQAKAVGAWIESKGLTQKDFDELDMLIDDWFWVRKNEVDDSGWD